MCRGRGVGRGRTKRDEVMSDGESVVVEEEEEEVMAVDDKKCSEIKWQITCSTLEEWEELVDNLSSIKTPTVKKLCRALEVTYTVM